MSNFEKTLLAFGKEFSEYLLAGGDMEEFVVTHSGDILDAAFAEQE